MKGNIMTENTVEETMNEEIVPRFEKIKNRLKKIDPIYYTTAAIAAVGVAGFVVYKRIDNFETREAERLVIVPDTTDV